MNEYKWPLANFGANESNKECPTCGLIGSTVYRTSYTISGETKIRCRLCIECGRKWPTYEKKK